MRIHKRKRDRLRGDLVVRGSGSLRAMTTAVPASFAACLGTPEDLARVRAGTIGRDVLLVKFAPWCGACHHGALTFADTRRVLRESDDVTVMAVNADDRAMAEALARARMSPKAFPEVQFVAADGRACAAIQGASYVGRADRAQAYVRACRRALGARSAAGGGGSGGGGDGGLRGGFVRAATTKTSVTKKTSVKKTKTSAKRRTDEVPRDARGRFVRRRP